MSPRELFLIKYSFILNLNGCDNMALSFSFGRKQKMGTLMVKYVNKRIRQKKSYEEQLERLDAQLQHENIDKLERDRLRTILEAKYYKQQQKDWDQIQKRLQ